MPTNLTDVTGSRKGEMQEGFGSVCTLNQVLSGRVCFPLLPAFGCNAEREIGVEKEQSVELKMGGGIEKVASGELTIGTKTTRSEKWIARADRCEWCEPELCFPHSTVEIWTCYGLWTLYFHRYERARFRPGANSELLSNCVENREKCKCPPEVREAGHPLANNARSSLSDFAYEAIILKPLQFARENQQFSGDPTATAKAFASLYESQISDSSGERPTAVGVACGAGSINWLYPRDHDERPRVSVISVDYPDRHSPEVPALFRGRFLPILAVMPRLVNEVPQVSATVVGPEGTTRDQIQAAEVGHSDGLFTTIFVEFDLGAVVKGSEIVVSIRIIAPDGLTVAHAKERFRAFV